MSSQLSINNPMEQVGSSQAGYIDETRPTTGAQLHQAPGKLNHSQVVSRPGTVDVGYKKQRKQKGFIKVEKNEQTSIPLNKTTSVSLSRKVAAPQVTKKKSNQINKASFTPTNRQESSKAIGCQNVDLEGELMPEQSEQHRASPERRTRQFHSSLRISSRDEDSDGAKSTNSNPRVFSGRHSGRGDNQDQRKRHKEAQQIIEMMQKEAVSLAKKITPEHF